jgi:hypothetical protein
MLKKGGKIKDKVTKLSNKAFEAIKSKSESILKSNTNSDAFQSELNEISAHKRLLNSHVEVMEKAMNFLPDHDLVAFYDINSATLQSVHKSISETVPTLDVYNSIDELNIE